VTPRIWRPDEAWLAPLLAALAADGLALVPTETVYGVVARVDRPAGVAALYAAKGRPAGQPLQVLVGSPAAGRALAREWPPSARALADRWWPGPLTLVVPAADALPAEVRAADGSVGLRCPDHELARELLAAAGPLAASSANRAGEPPANTCAEAVAALGEAVAAALDDGPVRGGVPSSVVRIARGGWELLRAGALTTALIEATLDG